MLERYRSSEELLPHDVVELILERLPVKSLLRLRSVSKTWKFTIQTRRFQERQLSHRRRSRDPDILLVQYARDGCMNTDARRFVFGSSIAYTVCFPTSCRSVCHYICDGLVCFYTDHDPSVCVVVVNPATRWHQSLPLARYQQLSIDRVAKKLFSACDKFGFGKDKLRGTYKPVILYNSYELGLDNVTTCEVFDFSINTWRYVHPASPYQIIVLHAPVYLDGSLCWLTECEETKVLSFDLHTETFQVICKAPFSHVHDLFRFSMCILDNCLCVSESNWPTQDIWLLDSSGGNINTWKKMYSIDLTKPLRWCGHHGGSPVLTIAVLEKNKLLIRGHGRMKPLVIYDLHTKSYELVFTANKPFASVCHFESLFSALSN
ncbi:unnamed protein product [Brassica oleracea]